MTKGKYIRTEKHRQRASEIMKEISNRPRTDVHRLNISQSLSGKPKSKAHCDKVSIARKKQVFGSGICECCKLEYEKTAANQRVCKICVPVGFSSNMFFRYGLSKSKYAFLLTTNNGMCWICFKRKAKVVDHDHKTGKVRGLLCKFCNVALSIFEDHSTRQRMEQYLNSDILSVQFQKDETEAK